jgi:hypothetical protein
VEGASYPFAIVSTEVETLLGHCLLRRCDGQALKPLSGLCPCLQASSFDGCPTKLDSAVDDEIELRDLQRVEMGEVNADSGPRNQESGWKKRSWTTQREKEVGGWYVMW